MRPIMKSVVYLFVALAILSTAECATSAIGKAKQAGLASKTVCESSYSTIYIAYKRNLLDESRFMQADKLYDDYVFWQGIYYNAVKAVEAGGDPTTLQLSAAQLSHIANSLADMVAAWGLEDEK